VPLLFSSRLSLERLRHLSIFCCAALVLSRLWRISHMRKRAVEAAPSPRRYRAPQTTADTSKTRNVACQQKGRPEPPWRLWETTFVETCSELPLGCVAFATKMTTAPIAPAPMSWSDRALDVGGYLPGM
jgi:hypothetical protein